MRILDYPRSAVFFQVDLDRMPPRTLSHQPPFAYNNARVQLDCSVRITDKTTAQVHGFVLGVSCKTERVAADADLWLTPNADFVPVFSDTQFMHIKTYARAGTTVGSWPPDSGEQGDRLVTPIDEAFAGAYLDLVEHDATVLSGATDIVEATHAGDPLVCRMTLSTVRYTAEIEFPVKTMNANERDRVYQTDTGPVLFPDLDRDPGDLLAGMELAFVAVNAPDWAEVIVRRRTAITPEVDVYHYVDPIRLRGINTEVLTFRSPTEPIRRRVELPVAPGGIRS